MNKIKIVKETDNELILSCGCKIKVIGKNFFISICSEKCKVFNYVLEESEKQGNLVTIRRYKK